MPRRKKLGATYTKSPIQNVKEGFTNNFSKIMFGIVYALAFLGVLYMIVGIIVFLGTHFSNWDEETTTIGMFNSPYCLPWKVGGIIAVFLYVFKDNLTKR